MVANPLSAFFHRGDAQNKSMYFTYCKTCVTEELKKRGATATTLQTFKDVGSTRGEKSAWIAHILGGRTPCLYASAEATAEATLQRRSQKRAQTESTPTSGVDVPLLEPTVELAGFYLELMFHGGTFIEPTHVHVFLINLDPDRSSAIHMGY
ncbi:hypothetical protein B0H14DRAFT_3149453 [Mycena olivaceomarginata]|nr:hypothetical protein B0H14DRAFT_3149453 [Mycena olivaceomarginata]